ncbi:hypothetical protein [Microvirga sp. G4-2]|uniref:hypothetical protein n=1 Tax=Microvirga sp. G4-2 TaxID=3434467 RepID=UPI00404505FD
METSSCGFVTGLPIEARAPDDPKLSKSLRARGSVLAAWWPEGEWVEGSREERSGSI